MLSVCPVQRERIPGPQDGQGSLKIPQSPPPRDLDERIQSPNNAQNESCASSERRDGCRSGSSSFIGMTCKRATNLPIEKVYIATTRGVEHRRRLSGKLADAVIHRTVHVMGDPQATESIPWRPLGQSSSKAQNSWTMLLLITSWVNILTLVTFFNTRLSA